MDGISWSAVAVITPVILAWSALLLAAIKWFLNRYHEGIKQRFDDLCKKFDSAAKYNESRFSEVARQIGEHARDAHRIDKEVLKLRGEVVREYVRREDHIRSETVINSKLDSVAEKVQTLVARSESNAGH